jgi:hypothetical protein
MARWSNASLVKLGGTDRNVIIDEILYGEGAYWDVQFNAPTNNRVVGVNSQSNQIRISGDPTIHVVGDFISFTCNSTLYEIVAVQSDIITVNQPVSSELTGEYVQLPIDITNSQVLFRLTQRIATVVDGRNGLDIVDIKPIVGAPEVIGDVSVTVPGQLQTRGEARLILAATDIVGSITPLPELDNDQVIMLTGYFSVTNQATDPSTPAQTKKQRFCVVIRTDGIVV